MSELQFYQTDWVRGPGQTLLSFVYAHPVETGGFRVWAEVALDGYTEPTEDFIRLKRLAAEASIRERLADADWVEAFNVRVDSARPAEFL